MFIPGISNYRFSGSSSCWSLDETSGSHSQKQQVGPSNIHCIVPSYILPAERESREAKNDDLQRVNLSFKLFLIALSKLQSYQLEQFLHFSEGGCILSEENQTTESTGCNKSAQHLFHFIKNIKHSIDEEHVSSQTLACLRLRSLSFDFNTQNSQYLWRLLGGILIWYSHLVFMHVPKHGFGHDIFMFAVGAPCCYALLFHRKKSLSFPLEPHKMCNFSMHQELEHLVQIGLRRAEEESMQYSIFTTPRATHNYE